MLTLPDVRTKKGTRDKAMLELLYSTGIRRSELTALNLYDLNREMQTIKVTGKGGKERVVPVGDVALYWLGRCFYMVRLPHNTQTYPERNQKEQVFFRAQWRKNWKIYRLFWLANMTLKFPGKSN